MRRFLGAVQFLTVLPVPGKTASLSQSAVFFPLVGALLGASTSLIVWLANHAFNKAIAALLGIAFLIAVTGCLHEDGLADVADAFRSGRSHQKIMSILKDSRIGTYGGIALVVSMLLRWLALADLKVNPAYGLTAVLALSRASLVVLAGSTPAVGDGLGKLFAAGLSKSVLTVTVIQAFVLSFLVGWRYAAALWMASAAVIALTRLKYLRALGGVNGDCLGATCQVLETLSLLILACRVSF